MQTVYTVFAYKPSGTDICMGCVMAEYSSDFRCIITSSIGDAAKFVGECLYENKHLDCNEPGYEITILVNGREYPLGDDEGELFDEIDCVRREIMDQANVIAEQREREFQEREKNKAEQAAALAAKQKRDVELAQLAELKKKYESGS
jgi:hypothetical protein